MGLLPFAQKKKKKCPRLFVGYSHFFENTRPKCSMVLDSMLMYSML